MSSRDFLLDEDRAVRIGLSEAVYCASKSPEQIAAILDHAAAEEALSSSQGSIKSALPVFPTPIAAAWITISFPGPGIRGPLLSPKVPPSSPWSRRRLDVPVATEAARTLFFEGVASKIFADVGVAGLWRLLGHSEELRRFQVVIIVAGMDAALPSVVAGLLPGLVIAVPTSVGYGVAEGGHAALNAILSSCAPGIVCVNIDNGYGGACAAIRALGQSRVEQR